MENNIDCTDYYGLLRRRMREENEMSAAAALAAKEAEAMEVSAGDDASALPDDTCSLV